MNVWVIEPGHGSVWLTDAKYVDDGRVVEGRAWDNSSSGSSLMPDDYSGEWVTLAFPVNLILKVEP